MKHPKKSFVSVVLAVAMVITCFLLLCSCAKQEPEMLPDPQNFRVENRVITWDPVENATGYLVTLDGKEYSIKENRFDYHFLDVADTYTFSVIALGDSEKYGNSAIAYYEFTLKSPVEHGFDSRGFEYTFDYDIFGYEINAGTADLSGTVVVPDYFGDWPVKRIAKKMFAADGAWSHWSKSPDEFSERYCNTITTAIKLPAYLESIEGYALAFVVNLEEIVIPDSVVEIQSGAFKGCTSLKKVAFPPNLKEIPFECFMNTALSELILPTTLEVIGISAFSTAVESNAYGTYNHINSSLAEVVIPASVNTIENGAFKGRWNLKTVTMEENVENLAGNCFDDTAWLDSQPDGFVYLKDYLYCYKGEIPENAKIEVPVGTKGICDKAFKDQKNLREVVLPEGIEYWGKYIFAGCSALTTVSLPEDMKTIPSVMFSGCTNLKTVIIPEGVERIDFNAFASSGLESIIIPGSVKSIGSMAFSYCESLKDISFPAGVEILAISVIDGCSALETVFIPASVKEIGNYPFRGCDALTHVFYGGSSFDEFIKKIKIDFEGNEDQLDMLKNDPIYYYSEEKPTEEGLYWHYVDGKPTPWEAEE